MKRIVVIALLLFALPAAASEIVFEIVDEEGFVKTGVLSKLDAETIVLGNETLSPERIVRLKNLDEHPYLSKKPDSKEVSPGRQTLKTGKQSLSTILERKTEDGETGEKAKPYPETVAVIDLSDGSKLVAVKFTLKGKTAICRLLDEREISVPVDGIVSARLGVKGFSAVIAPPADWNRLSASSDKGDRIIVGQPGSLDVYEGILSEVGEETVSFIIDGETLPVPRRKVFGLVFHAAAETQPNSSEVIGTLTLRDGGLVRFVSLVMNEEGRIRWTSRQGLEGTSDFEEIDVVDFSRNHSVFLVDLQPIRIEHSLLFDRTKKADQAEKQTPSDFLRNFRTNRIKLETVTEENLVQTVDPVLQAIRQRRTNRTGRENTLPERPMPGLDGVRLDGVSYEKGLRLPAGTVLEYSLPESFSMVRGVVGIDDRQRPDGAVRLAFQVDDRFLGEISVRGDERAQKFAFDLPDRSAMLRIIVDFSGKTAGSASVGLGDVKLIK